MFDEVVGGNQQIKGLVGFFRVVVEDFKLLGE